MELKLYNTATRKVEPFAPLAPPDVKMYSCGMTVYDYAHVGNLLAYTNADVLRRALEYAGYRVRQVMNVTDVGHMTSDADEGEDKLELRAQRDGATPWDIARKYEDYFYAAIARLNIRQPHVSCRATEHIPEQIALVQRLEERGFTYQTKAGVVFDTAKFPRYAEFARLNLDGNEEGFRTHADPDRRSPSDFSLWVTDKPDHLMQWDSPWGSGYPGWHLECSAMAMHYLGEEIDIHTGGIDHVPIHHTNEIAQSECATGKTFSRFWLHSAFMNIDNQKMSKSLGNLYTLEDLAERGVAPLALRYFFLGSSYRKPMNFTWEALGAAQTGMLRLWQACDGLPAPAGEPLAGPLEEFEQALGDDLNTSQSLAVLWGLLDADECPARKARTIIELDRVLGLGLSNARTLLNDYNRLTGATKDAELKARELANRRQELRQAKKFAEADQLRDEITALGFAVEDTPEGPVVRPA
ncbi:cysteine--tRNA ligase [Candidatus Sumerlaeota bacterium]